MPPARARKAQILSGEQVEYLVVAYDDENRKAKLSLRQADILAALASDEKLLEEGGGVPDMQEVETKSVREL